MIHKKILDIKLNTIRKINKIYNKHEAKSISLLIFEHFNFNNDNIIKKFNTENLKKIEYKINLIIDKIKHLEPIQYVLGYGYFYNKKIFLSKSVLIPRQETEILVHFFIQIVNKKKNFNLLEVGTGSGCIPSVIEDYYKKARIDAVDISKSAIITAKKNCLRTNFINLNIFLDFEFGKKYDYIISNPPYVTKKEKKQMHRNVLDYEPHIALFVENNNPIAFYKRIIDISKKILKPKGYIFFEINEKMAKLICEYSMKNKFNFNVIKDLNEKDRVVVLNKIN